MQRLLHLMTLDPILKLTYEHLVIKNIFSMFLRFITISIQNLAWNKICLNIKKIKLFYSSTYFLIFALNDLWPNFWPSYANSDLASTPMFCTHAKYCVKSGLTNVLKNANKTKNMHLFSIRIAN